MFMPTPSQWKLDPCTITKRHGAIQVDAWIDTVAGPCYQLTARNNAAVADARAHIDNLVCMAHAAEMWRLLELLTTQPELDRGQRDAILQLLKSLEAEAETLWNELREEPV